MIGSCSPRGIGHPGRDQRGVILVTTLTFIMVLSILAAALLSLASNEVAVTFVSRNRIQAFYLAEGGAEWARRALSLNQDLDEDGVLDQTQVFTNNQVVIWDSSPQLSTLIPGATGQVTVARHPGDPDLAVITSMAVLPRATKTIEILVRKGNPLPPGVKGAATANGPVATNGSITLDGRDHDLNGSLIAQNGTFGIFTASTYSQGGSSKVGGTDPGGTDHAPARPGDPSVIQTNGSWDDPSTPEVETMPTTPDQVMGGVANGYPEGTLKQIAMSGVNGSQYVTDPTRLRFPLSGVTYVELPPGGIWNPVNLGDSTGILIVHNSAGNAVIKNINPSGTTCGCFTGLIIADDIVHIHTKIIGAVVSLTTGPSSGNVIGNGSGQVLFSREALTLAAGAGGRWGKVFPLVSWREVR